MIEAQVICDSISPQGHRLTTFKLRYPKFIHGEFMTHRMLSRNASSSRAVPTAKLLEEVRSDALRAAPVFWGKNQPGMQAAEELDAWSKEGAQIEWRMAAIAAAQHAEQLLMRGCHKQIVNRLLEPFSHINVVASATEWENFFGLRLHRDAQPEMRALAEAMWSARAGSTPTPLLPGEWHLPFVDQPTLDECFCHGEQWTVVDGKLDETQVMLEKAKRVSVARCARVSYESFETGRRSSIAEDLQLYSRLLGAQQLHASPAEHQATPDQYEYCTCGSGSVCNDCRGPRNPQEHGNFFGWRQLRKMLPGEAQAPLPEGFSK